MAIKLPLLERARAELSDVRPNASEAEVIKKAREIAANEGIKFDLEAEKMKYTNYLKKIKPPESAKSKVEKTEKPKKAAKTKAEPVKEKPKTTKTKAGKGMSKQKEKSQEPVAPVAPEPVAEPPEAAPVAAKKAGRPRKHTNGGQVSIWLTPETLKALKIKALEMDMTFPDLVAKIIDDNFKKY